MSEELIDLLNECANFIQPYNDGGNEAERLIIRIDKALEGKKSVDFSCIDSLIEKYEGKITSIENLKKQPQEPGYMKSTIETGKERLDVRIYERTCFIKDLEKLKT